MDFILKLIAPLENYDFSNFLHNFVLAIPASVLAGIIIFFLLLAFKKLQSKEYRLYISLSFILIIAVTSSLHNIGVKTDTLFAVYTEWLHLIVRWAHIIFGVAWIGTSFYFNWLDSRLERDDPDFKHLDGYLWSVHSGGFYRIEKLKGPPESLPKVLHWFKWEAYATWISGFVLMILVYYFNTSSMMLKSDGYNLTPSLAIALSLSLLFGSWFLYDFICKNIDENKQELLVIIGFVIFVLFSYFLTEIYGSRAAYIHVGAIIGTIMAANVFRVIIPAQKNLVTSAENKQKPNLQLSIDAKNRSIHNNYFTLPVLFIMISSHFSFTYGAVNNWLILVILSLAGILTRHYFNLRNKKKYKVWILPSAALMMFFLMVFSSLSIFDNDKKQVSSSLELVSFNEVQNIIKYRCGTCHAKNPTFEGIEVAPKGVIYDTTNDIIKNLKLIQAQAIDSEIMPPNNLTGITNQERQKLRIWIEQGANINN
ncbi:urate hydroxylase PuuD [Alphaproteobacteria bacterium]|nr:urate hydroxylase PuuD [Alphaproteobacteria bacterium]